MKRSPQPESPVNVLMVTFVLDMHIAYLFKYSC